MLDSSKQTWIKHPVQPFVLPSDDRETVSATEKETMKKEYKIK